MVTATSQRGREDETWKGKAGASAPWLSRSGSRREGQSRHAERLGVCSVVEQSSKQIGIEHFGAHDLHRTCAKLCRKSGGDLEQIKFLLGHSSIQTTKKYLGSD